ncbi:FHA domain-containing protein [Pollutimonas harenae]|uniref:FHA domain-containing protein n=1 Tax=Pollutimonas harenae TaxID=657015 RepID=A0A853H379_9BURK|nr:FHA domain-containing protein [Pollutimonas harenae]NYT86480.1 hypothetical protein [Pollutimonas harenae]TEA69775.1 hypothetical protein ERD84_13615 [Pollutimonas harenae]
MKLVATHIPTAQAATFEFTEPGGTIGRCPGNHLLLSEDARVGRIQAVVRIQDGALSLKNVSSQTDIVINGQALSLLQEMPISCDDTLLIGDYMLRAAPAPDLASGQTIQEAGSADIFKELLDGPGVLPVGQSAEASELHPFQLTSQAPRNHPDPIQQLQEDHQSHTYGGLAYGPLDTEPEQHDSHIFSNPAPSTLNLDDPLGPQCKSLIDEALAQGHVSETRHENR